MNTVKFKYTDEACVYPKLIQAVIAVCNYYKKDCLCSSGYRSLEKQKVINIQSLHSHKNAYQITDPNNKMYGAVYKKRVDIVLLSFCVISMFGKELS